MYHDEESQYWIGRISYFEKNTKEYIDYGDNPMAMESYAERPIEPEIQQLAREILTENPENVRGHLSQMPNGYMIKKRLIKASGYTEANLDLYYKDQRHPNRKKPDELFTLEKLNASAIAPIAVQAAPNTPADEEAPQNSALNLFVLAAERSERTLSIARQVARDCTALEESLKKDKKPLRASHPVTKLSGAVNRFVDALNSSPKTPEAWNDLRFAYDALNAQLEKFPAGQKTRNMKEIYQEVRENLPIIKCCIAIALTENMQAHRKNGTALVNADIATQLQHAQKLISHAGTFTDKKDYMAQTMESLRSFETAAGADQTVIHAALEEEKKAARASRAKER